jgi:hypothetical protein
VRGELVLHPGAYPGERWGHPASRASRPVLDAMGLQAPLFFFARGIHPQFFGRLSGTRYTIGSMGSGKSTTSWATGLPVPEEPAPLNAIEALVRAMQNTSPSTVPGLVPLARPGFPTPPATAFLNALTSAPPAPLRPLVAPPATAAAAFSLAVVLRNPPLRSAH